MLFWLDPLLIVFLAITFVISISLHEYAHARASDKLWDPTPRIQWRLTPNPLVHIDPLWFLMIFIIQFGRWRPVQVNPHYYKNTLRDELLVALAWPATNIILAFIATAFVLFYIRFTWVTGLFEPDMIIRFWVIFAQLNIALAVFNMIPVPPLDWYRIIKYLFPSAWFWLEKNTKIIGLVFLWLLLLPTPARWGIISIITTVSQVLYWIMHAFWAIIIF